MLEAALAVESSERKVWYVAKDNEGVPKGTPQASKLVDIFAHLDSIRIRGGTNLDWEKSYTFVEFHTQVNLDMYFCRKVILMKLGMYYISES